MAELRKCSRCRSEIELTYFAINRKGEHNKTCETCLNKVRTHQAAPEAKDKRKHWNGMLVTCSNCGETHTKNTLSLHKRRYWCQTYHLKNRPDFEHWLVKQDYDTLLWEYKQLFNEMVSIQDVLNNQIQQTS